jgi:hypothetical protein
MQSEKDAEGDDDGDDVEILEIENMVSCSPFLEDIPI